MNKKYVRSEYSREKFIRKYPSKNGKYRCVYCGKKIRVEDMEVDHIIPVRAAQKHLLYRLMLPEGGVNAVENLVPSCWDCNRKKGRKCGLWVIRGKYWKVMLPIRKTFQLLAFGVSIYFIYSLAMCNGGDIETTIQQGVTHIEQMTVTAEGFFQFEKMRDICTEKEPVYPGREFISGLAG